MRNSLFNIVLLMFLSLIMTTTVYGMSSTDGYIEEDPDYFESYWREGVKVMVTKLPVYQKMNLDSKIIYEIPYGSKCKYKLNKGDYAWMLVDYKGKIGYTLIDGCSFNGINEEKGKKWFEAELNNVITTLRENPHAYDDDMCIDGYEQEAPVVYEKYNDNPGDIYYEPGLVSRLFFYIGGAVLAFIILWLISRTVNNTLSYFIKTYGCGICLIIIIINIGRYVEIRNVTDMLPYYCIVMIAWAAWWKYYFYRMALDTTISNENIKVSLFCTVVAACVWILTPLTELAGWNIIGVIVSAILLWIVDSPTRHRCPECHRMKAIYFNRREKAGTHTEETNDLNTSKVDTRNLGNNVEVDYETKRIYRTVVYQMWRHYYKCRFCGFEISKRKKGSRIADNTRSVVVEKMTKRY